MPCQAKSECLDELGGPGNLMAFKLTEESLKPVWCYFLYQERIPCVRTFKRTCIKSDGLDCLSTRVVPLLRDRDLTVIWIIITVASNLSS